MKQSNTAICFSGELRTFNKAMPRILKYFKEFQADLFCHTWSATGDNVCLLYTSPSPRDRTRSRMPSSA